MSVDCAPSVHFRDLPKKLRKELRQRFSIDDDSPDAYVLPYRALKPKLRKRVEKAARKVER